MLPRNHPDRIRVGDGPQPGSLDGANRSGRADRDHQDPPAAVLRPGAPPHPLGAPPHPASPPALALGNPVQSRPGVNPNPPREGVWLAS